MPNLHRLGPATLTLFATCILAASPAHATVTVTSLAAGTEDASITGLAIEDFEDTTLLPGFSVTFSVWRNFSNVITANPPVTYSGTLPATWSPGATISFPLNAWDGTHALVNGWGFVWNYPYAASVKFDFNPGLSSVGMGLSNFQHDASSGLTYHTVYVNGVAMGRLEDMPYWTSTASGKNLYLLVTATSDTPIQSITFTDDTHYDGLVFDKLALGDIPTPTHNSSWGRIKGLYR